MTLVPYFLTVNLTVSCVFILTFAFVAIQERNYAAPRWFTLASIAAALVAIFGYWIPLAENPRLLVLASFSLLMAAFLAITIGLQSIYHQKIDWKFYCGFFLAAIICNLLIYDLPRTSFLHRFLYQLPLCLAQLWMIRVIYLSRMPRLVDKLMMGLAIFSCIYYLSKAFLIAWPGSDMRPEDDANTWHVIVSLAVGVLVQVARGLLLLLSTVSHMVGEASEQSEVDELSQIYNRRGFDRHVSRVLARKGARIRYSVIMSDLDFFKRVNDTYGHDGGDRVIAAFGKLLKTQLPKAAVAARMGGEEFVVFIPDNDMAAAEALAQSLREALCELRFTGKSPAWSPTASFGVAEQIDDESLYETMRRADAALYQAKKAGRNRVHIA
ncbi:GGDEF domain-containing protein [Brucella sp. NBRC 12950]|uniref:GGDEF domain-containing protein n=1 Tax=Brucella sp. NBRC 12950 TaxID=2994518 RepID=UPI0024A43762|nr:GGDEF domain-containing protein [Brucella sp. NBRC 12950]GLU28914.1 GGDEF domain-containing protein [Brucella sp. NBRC 12950]